MTPAETDRTAALIRRLAERHTVVVIDHDMAFVEKLAAPVTVLHLGRVLKHGDIHELRDDPDVIEQYLEFAWSFATSYFVMQKGRIVDRGRTADGDARAVSRLLGV